MAKEAEAKQGLPLGIDVGGSGIKGAPVDLSAGAFAAKRLRIDTPARSTPQAVAEIIDQIVDHFDDVRGDSPIGVTIPGVVTHGVVRSAANIDKSWLDFDAEPMLEKVLEPRHRPGQRRRRGRGGRAALRRRQGAAGPGRDDDPGDRHRHGPDLRRRADPQLRARSPRDRRPRRGVPGGVVDQGQGGPELPGVGRAAPALLQPPRGVAVAGPHRRRRRGVQGRREVPAAARAQDTHRARQAREQGRHHRCRPPCRPRRTSSMGPAADSGTEARRGPRAA